MDEARTPVVPVGTTLLVKTATKTSYPTVAGAFYYCQVQTAMNSEGEGAPEVLSDDPENFLYALNLGTKIPPVGTNVTVTRVSDRWVFRYDE